MIRRGGRNVGGPVPVRDRSTSRRRQSQPCEMLSRQTTCRRPPRFLRRQLLRPRRLVLPVRRRSSSGPGRGIRPSAVRGIAASSRANLRRRRRPHGWSHDGRGRGGRRCGNPSPRRPIRPVRRCAEHRGQDRAVSRRPDHPVCSSLLPRTPAAEAPLAARSARSIRASRRVRGATGRGGGACGDLADDRPAGAVAESVIRQIGGCARARAERVVGSWIRGPLGVLARVLVGVRAGPARVHRRGRQLLRVSTLGAEALRLRGP